MGEFNQGFPQAPFVDSQTGDIANVWRFFLMSLFNRTGGGIGTSTAALQTAIDSETAKRTAADATIVTSLTAETAARAAADDTETKARIAADDAFEASLTGGRFDSTVQSRWWFGRS